MPKPLERRQRNRESDKRRRHTKPWRSFYNTVRWQAKREAQLQAEPLCQRCKEAGHVVKATVAHHKVRHDGNPDLFWNGELSSSCKDHHDALEQAIEVRGFEIGCDASGRPVALDHPWNLKKLEPGGG